MLLDGVGDLMLARTGNRLQNRSVPLENEGGHNRNVILLGQLVGIVHVDLDERLLKEKRDFDNL